MRFLSMNFNKERAIVVVGFTKGVENEITGLFD